MKRHHRPTRKQVLIATIVMVSMIAAGPLYALFAANDLNTFGQIVIYVLTTCSLYGIWLTFMRKRYYFRFAWVFLLFNLFDIAHVFLYDSTTSLMWVFSGIKSEGGEGMELISVGAPLLLSIAAIWTVYFVLNRRFIAREYVASPRIRAIVAGCLGGWLLIAFGGFTVHKLTDRMASFEAVGKVTPINYFYDLGEIVVVSNIIQNGHNRLADFRFNASTTAQDDEVVLLLIGESTRYRQWQMNGYQRPTSPRLMARGETLISYDSVYTVANLTTLSVPLMLSRATPNNLSLYWNEPSVVDAFQEAGYHTSWIADQSFNNHYLMNISGNCDFVYYHDHRSYKFYDEDMLEPLTQCLNQNVGRQLIVVHSLGCHFKYSSRYPEEYHVFRPDLNEVDWSVLRENEDWSRRAVDEGDKKSPTAALVRRILTNSYDNAILHTDMFIDSVITTLEQTGRPIIMLYVADHGENLLDNEENRILHGEPSTSVYEYHVPLFVWASDSYQARYPERMEALRSNRQVHVSTMNIYHSLLDLGSVTIDSLRMDKSIASPHLIGDTTAWIIDSNLHLASISVEEE